MYPDIEALQREEDRKLRALKKALKSGDFETLKKAAEEYIAALRERTSEELAEHGRRS
jgi:hypothetical protein